jgi:WXG100 family type VII secretion target
MTTVGIRVTPEQLLGLSGRVGSGATQIQGELDQLRRALAPLGADWAGQAQLQFTALWATWDSGARQVQEALTGISGLLAQAGRAYGEAERQIAATFRSG